MKTTALTKVTKKAAICGFALAMAGVASTAWADPRGGPLTECPPDAVISGTVCMDKYEASVWRVPTFEVTPRGVRTANTTRLIAKIRQGTATEADLKEGGAIQVGLDNWGEDDAPCMIHGRNCGNLLAVSLPGVRPARAISWLQAQQACKNARKRLPTNAEWQAAVAGTPDPGPDNGTTDCNTNSAVAPVATGSRSSCKSADEAFDMVGNMYEWVADWVPPVVSPHGSNFCGSWGAGVSPTDDDLCPYTTGGTDAPAALQRGGAFWYVSSAGPLALETGPPYEARDDTGFRCAR
jgi:formylglycine-generating enzyme required for sulfatase activity